MIPRQDHGGPFEGARAKASWALKRFHELEAATSTYLEDDPWFMERVRVTDSRSFVQRFRVVRPPPLDLGLIAGDLVNNARAALDHSVFALAGDQAGRWNQFTIATDRAGWDKNWRKDLRGLSTEDVARIERVQPFAHPEQDRHPLMLIQWFSNTDKHQVLHPALAVFKNLSMFSPQTGHLSRMGQVALYPSGPVVDGDCLARWELEEGVEEPEVQFSIGIEVAFGDRLVSSRELFGMADFAMGMTLALGTAPPDRVVDGSP
jgi:hypothetical protein